MILRSFQCPSWFEMRDQAMVALSSADVGAGCIKLSSIVSMDCPLMMIKANA